MPNANVTTTATPQVAAVTSQAPPRRNGVEPRTGHVGPNGSGTGPQVGASRPEGPKFGLAKERQNDKMIGRMSTDQINAEQQAIQSLMRLLEHAKECEGLYVRARMSLPEPLKRLLAVNGTGNAVAGPPAIPAPQKPPMPPGAKSDWIYIQEKDATPTSIALAILHGSKEPIRAKEIIVKVTAILPNVLRGSINNIGSRLAESGLIYRTREGWTLAKIESAGILYEGNLWGPRDIFQKSELAAHRRDAILHVLSNFDSGLQTRQLVEQLGRCSWVHAPVNKDLLKADLEILSRLGKVRRRGNSKKWEVIKGES